MLNVKSLSRPRKSLIRGDYRTVYKSNSFFIPHFFAGSFYAGIPQEATLAFHSGSYSFSNDLPVTLSLPTGLSLTGKDIKEDGTVQLAPARPYESQEFQLGVFAQPSAEYSDVTQYKVRRLFKTIKLSL